MPANYFIPDVLKYDRYLTVVQAFLLIMRARATADIDSPVVY